MRRSLSDKVTSTEWAIFCATGVIVFGILYGLTGSFFACVLFGVLVGGALITSIRYYQSMKSPFVHDKFNDVWKSSEERYASLQRVLKVSGARTREELKSIPAYVDSVRENLFDALSRADSVLTQIKKLNEESGRFSNPNVQAGPGSDLAAKALLTQADRNRAEYRMNLQAVMGGVERAEAQVILFMTTVDNLRVRMVGYGLKGQQTEASAYEFTELLADMRSQLKSIDAAMEELNLPLFSSGSKRTSFEAPNQSANHPVPPPYPPVQASEPPVTKTDLEQLAESNIPQTQCEGHQNLNQY